MQSVVVTGASTGIGWATARLLLDRGFRVFGSVRKQADADRLKGEFGANFTPLLFDVTDEAAVLAAAREVRTALNGETLSGLVNNAGIAGPYPATFETETVEQWQKILSINVQGVFLGCKHSVQAMRQSGGGSIVNTSSLAAFLGTPDLSAYGASKGAVRQFTKTVAMDCARKGYKVRCNSVHPGIIMTPMGQGILPDEKKRERMRKAIPVGEFGAPEDIAYGILYLISDESRFVTGTELVIDGGMNAI